MLGIAFPVPALPPSGFYFGRRVPALNTDPAFIEDMADMVVEALALPTLTVSEVRVERVVLHPVDTSKSQCYRCK